MKNKISSILCKINQPPFGIRKTDGSWKIFAKNVKTKDLLSSLESLISKTYEEEKETQNSNGWEKLVSFCTANYLKSHHPNMALVDVSTSRNFVIFSQIQGHNINCENWKGGHAGSVQLISNDAKLRTIAEIIERTALSKLSENIWSSAVAPNLDQAMLYAKMEAIERKIILNWWKGDKNLKITENLIPYLPIHQRNMIEAISFEWEPYHGNIQCSKILNPFGLEIVIAVVDILFLGKNLRFYGNGFDLSLLKAVEKACIETLQFIPGPLSTIWNNIGESKNENDQRIHAWFKKPNNIFDHLQKFDVKFLNSSNNPEFVIKQIDKAFKSMLYKLNVFELQECPGLFVSYVTSQEDWRAEEGVPIV